MKEIIDAVSEHFIDFELSNAPDAKAIWINYKQSNISVTEFCHQYSYLISSTKAFSKVITDERNTTCSKIERYGGSGLGGNGGGARSANIAGMQVKGVGANIVVGQGVPDHHGYGGLDIYCAVVEVVSTELLNAIMPLGAIANKGLILIDRFAGVYDESECCAALLVRDIPLRPGHLLHAVDFKPKTSVEWNYRSEESRIRTIYRDIDQSLGITDFVVYLGKFLSASASQFAFARMSRILHGGLSESNMSLDGKWLDVPLVGFIPAGKNWSQQSDFYSEPFEVLRFIEQCAYNYKKYNKKPFNPQPLFDYYVEQFNEYKKLHCTFLLGLDSQQMESVYSREEVDNLCRFIESIIISKNPEAVKSYPQLNDYDSLDDEIINIWLSIISVFQGEEYANEVSLLFFSILKNVNVTTKRETIPLAIQSFKRTLLCRFFYLKNSIDQVREAFSNIGEDIDLHSYTTNYIDARIELINWIYEKNDNSIITLINIPELCIKYHSKQMYYDAVIGGNKVLFGKIEEIQYLLKNYKINMTYLDFNFHNYLQRITDLIFLLEEDRSCL